MTTETALRHQIANELEAEADACEANEVGCPPRSYATGVFRRAAQLVRDGAPRENYPRVGEQLRADVAAILNVTPETLAHRTHS
jgi:hypothetical protein